METKCIVGDRMQNILQSLAQCKKDYLEGKEECKKLREVNTRLEVELKEARELEKSHRYHLLSSREMIGNLQESVSQLVYLKRDMKKLTEDLMNKDSSIEILQKEKENIKIKCDSALKDLRSSHERQTEELADIHDRNVQQIQHEADIQIAQFSCVIEELRVKIKEMETEHRDKMSVVVLEYEEKLQRSAAQITQLHDQQAGLVARTDASIDAYRRRLEELEEKLKQNQFKHYLAQSTLPSHSQYERQVERPYSVNRDYVDSVELGPVLDTAKPNPTQPSTQTTQKKAPRPNTLQVIYYGNNTPNAQKFEKKGPFNIAKKRKLYNEKDFKDF